LDKKTFYPPKADPESATLSAVAYCMDLIDQGIEPEITVGPKTKKRSLSANAQQHVWYKAISEFTGDDIEDVEARCKRDFGLPIALADPDMGPKIDFMLKSTGFHKRTPQQQLGIMKLLAVTRFFSSSQHCAYRDAMQVTWNARGVYIDYQK